MKKKLKIPKFSNEDQERKFWSRVDLSKYAKVKDFAPVSFPNLKPSSRSISLRIPEHIFLRIKEQANELHVPYQSLMKKYIAEGMRKKS